MPYPNIPQNPADGATIDASWGQQVATLLRALGSLPQRSGEVLWTPDGTEIAALARPTQTSVLVNDQNGNVRWRQQAATEAWAQVGGALVPLARMTPEMLFAEQAQLPPAGQEGQYLVVQNESGGGEDTVLDITTPAQSQYPLSLQLDAAGLWMGTTTATYSVNTNSGAVNRAYGYARSVGNQRFALTSTYVWKLTDFGRQLVREQRIATNNQNTSTQIAQATALPNQNERLIALASSDDGSELWCVTGTYVGANTQYGVYSFNATISQCGGLNATAVPTLHVYKTSESSLNWQKQFDVEIGRAGQTAREIDIAVTDNLFFVIYKSGVAVSRDAAYSAPLQVSQFRASDGGLISVTDVQSNPTTTSNSIAGITAFGNTMWWYLGSTLLRAFQLRRRQLAASGSSPPGSHLYQSDGSAWIYRAKLGGADAAVTVRLDVASLTQDWALRANTSGIPWAKIMAAVNANVTPGLGQSAVDARVRALVDSLSLQGATSRYTLSRLAQSLLVGASIDANGRLVLNRNGLSPIVLPLPSGGGGQGTTVVANPGGNASQNLLKLQVGDVIYAIPAGGGGRTPTAAEIINLIDGDTGGDINFSNAGNNLRGSIRSTYQIPWGRVSGKPSFAPSNAEQNVQADWNETSTSSDAFIRNKPQIPTDVGADPVIPAWSAGTWKIGQLARHTGNVVYMCVVARTSSNTSGPDSDTTGWVAVTSYRGTWARGWYAQGQVVLYSGDFYICNTNISNDAANPATNSKWTKFTGISGGGAAPTLANVTSALGLDAVGSANRGKMIVRKNDDTGYSYDDVPVVPARAGAFTQDDEDALDGVVEQAERNEETIEALNQRTGDIEEQSITKTYQLSAVATQGGMEEVTSKPASASIAAGHYGAADGTNSLAVTDAETGTEILFRIPDGQSLTSYLFTNVTAHNWTNLEHVGAGGGWDYWYLPIAGETGASAFTIEMRFSTGIRYRWDGDLVADRIDDAFGFDTGDRLDRLEDRTHDISGHGGRSWSNTVVASQGGMIPVADNFAPANAAAAAAEFTNNGVNTVNIARNDHQSLVYRIPAAADASDYRLGLPAGVVEAGVVDHGVSGAWRYFGTRATNNTNAQVTVTFQHNADDYVWEGLTKPTKLIGVDADGTKFLKQDGTWADPPSGGGSGSTFDLVQVGSNQTLTVRDAWVTTTVTLAMLNDVFFVGWKDTDSPPDVGWVVMQKAAITAAGTELEVGNSGDRFKFRLNNGVLQAASSRNVSVILSFWHGTAAGGGGGGTPTPLSNAIPKPPGTAAAGTGTAASRSDHVHRPPTWGEVTGKPTIPPETPSDRLLPTLPATGSRDNKIPKFDGDTLGWEVDAGGGGAQYIANKTDLASKLEAIPAGMDFTANEGRDTVDLTLEFDDFDEASSVASTDLLLVENADGLHKVEVQNAIPADARSRATTLFDANMTFTTNQQFVAATLSADWDSFDAISIVTNRRSDANLGTILTKGQLSELAVKAAGNNWYDGNDQSAYFLIDQGGQGVAVGVSSNKRQLLFAMTTSSNAWTGPFFIEGLVFAGPKGDPGTDGAQGPPGPGGAGVGTYTQLVAPKAFSASDTQTVTVSGVKQHEVFDVVLLRSGTQPSTMVVTTDPPTGFARIGTSDAATGAGGNLASTEAIVITFYKVSSGEGDAEFEFTFHTATGAGGTRVAFGEIRTEEAVEPPQLHAGDGIQISNDIVSIKPPPYIGGFYGNAQEGSPDVEVLRLNDLVVEDDRNSVGVELNFPKGITIRGITPPMNGIGMLDGQEEKLSPVTGSNVPGNAPAGVGKWTGASDGTYEWNGNWPSGGMDIVVNITMSDFQVGDYINLTATCSNNSLWGSARTPDRGVRFGGAGDSLPHSHAHVYELRPSGSVPNGTKITLHIEAIRPPDRSTKAPIGLYRAGNFYQRYAPSSPTAPHQVFTLGDPVRNTSIDAIGSDAYLIPVTFSTDNTADNHLDVDSGDSVFEFTRDLRNCLFELLSHSDTVGSTYAFEVWTFVEGITDWHRVRLYHIEAATNTTQRPAVHIYFDSGGVLDGQQFAIAARWMGAARSKADLGDLTLDLNTNPDTRFPSRQVLANGLITTERIVTPESQRASGQRTWQKPTAAVNTWETVIIGVEDGNGAQHTASFDVRGWRDLDESKQMNANVYSQPALGANQELSRGSDGRLTYDSGSASVMIKSAKLYLER